MSVFNTLQFKLFFKPSMNYEEYFMCSYLAEIKAVKEMNLSKDQNMEYFMCFNETATKGIVV